ncbi:uncharacterized protein M421DRAFT_88975 [Didymella exigua CBS 183.55]|uniref:Uncharacterized protein n=1 Tax=Didymella exigua CBS 183.55 TaxID=1150837 RepID=A0A6A5RZD0_9PLEO|nr:uncharacterized protein M421DRAFT_88975 [Didymella exigua CBS 183.55]KAF1932594.1 hypothetical protein M421DRAFT_88975 [Didymella exigua CBS 183.55]
MPKTTALPITLLGDDDLAGAYMDWQLGCGETDETLGLIEYAADYVNFCIDEDPRSFDPVDASGRRVAVTCGHVLHPSTSDECEYCPVCIVITYLKALWLVTDVWDRIGGPWKPFLDPENIQLYQQLRRTWTRFRLELAQLTTTLEEEADNEALWEAQQMNSDIAADGVQAAANAVVVARTMTRYPVVGILGPQSWNKAPRFHEPLLTSKLRLSRRRIRFAPTTTVARDESVPDEVQAHPRRSQSPVSFKPGRPTEEWKRSDEEYDPGAHAAQHPEGWSDTSFAGDVLYTLEQLRVCINLSPFHLERSWIDAYSIESEGPACEHRFWNEIKAAVRAGLENGAVSKEELLHAHWLLVGTCNGVFQDVVLCTPGENGGDDFSFYIKWQKERALGSEIGQVRDALEYFRFIKYRDALISRTLPLSAYSILPSPPSTPCRHKSHTTSDCGHVYCSSVPTLAELCPVCEVTAHLSFLHAIRVAQDKAGGPRLHPGPSVWGKSYGAIRTGWHSYEQTWELKHPFEVEAERRTNCASAAIELALEQSRYPALLSIALLPSKKGRLVPKVNRVISVPKVQIKHYDQVFVSAIKFIRNHRRNTFARSSQTYESGEHACPPDFELLDTPGAKSDFGDINNLKIFVTDDEDAFDSIQENSHLFKDSVGEYKVLSACTR